MTRTHTRPRTWTPEKVAGVGSLEPGTIADLIVWMDQQGIPYDDRPQYWAVSGIGPEAVEEAEEIVEQRYDGVRRASTALKDKVKRKDGQGW